jgi:hypothetical protein
MTDAESELSFDRAEYAGETTQAPCAACAQPLHNQCPCGCSTARAALSRRDKLLVGLTGLCVALVLQQWLPAAVGAVAVARALPAQESPIEDRGVLALFAMLIVGHALLMFVAG